MAPVARRHDAGGARTRGRAFLLPEPALAKTTLTVAVTLQ